MPAPNTQEAYRRDLADLAGYLARRKKIPADADAGALRGYLSSLADAGMAPRSQARRLSALRQFYKFLAAEGLRPDDPTATLDSPRLGRPLPKLLDEQEVARADRGCPRHAGGGRAGSRIVLLLELLYGAGLRVSELVGLPLAAVLRQAKVLVLRGKGGKERMVPLGEPVRAALADYLAAARLLPGEGAGPRPGCSLPAAPRASDAPAPGAAAEGPGARGRDRAGAAQPPCAAPCLRHPSAGSRRRSAQRAEDAGPCRHRHDADLYPCRGRPAERGWWKPTIRSRGQGAARSRHRSMTVMPGRD